MNIQDYIGYSRISSNSNVDGIAIFIGDEVATDDIDSFVEGSWLSKINAKIRPQGFEADFDFDKGFMYREIGNEEWAEVEDFFRDEINDAYDEALTDYDDGIVTEEAKKAAMVVAKHEDVDRVEQVEHTSLWRIYLHDNVNYAVVSGSTLELMAEDEDIQRGRPKTNAEIAAEKAEQEKKFEQAIDKEFHSLKPLLKEFKKNPNKELKRDGWSINDDSNIFCRSGWFLSYNSQKLASFEKFNKGELRNQYSGSEKIFYRIAKEIIDVFPAAHLDYVDKKGFDFYYTSIVVNNPNVTEEELKEIAERPDASLGTFEAILKSSKCPSEVIDIMAKSTDYGVREAVASRPDLPMDQLEILVKDPEPCVRRAVASRPDLPMDQLEILVKDPASWVREASIDNPNITRKMLTELSTDSDSDVKWRAERKLEKMPKETEFEILKNRAERLAETYDEEEKDYDYFKTLLNSPKCTSDMIDIMVEAINPKARKAVASHPGLPMEKLEVLVKDPDYKVREATLYNPNITKEMLEAFLKDSYESTRCYARHLLKKFQKEPEQREAQTMPPIKKHTDLDVASEKETNIDR